ncbi:MAG: peptidylprolyl isomerase [Bacteroidales bacterium]|nr:peptidylprolyl isomerase [Bacteroidales bacterium]
MEQKQKEAMNTVATLPDEPVFDIVTNLGTIKVKLYANTPKHRENFAKLALSGYYNGLLFHRVINGFMIQGGDPLTKDPTKIAQYGTGGPGYTVPAEFVPEYKHKKGALAAARRGDTANPMKESSGSQFYIVQNEAACAALDGDYTVFGETISGFEVIDRIASVQTDGRDRPINDVRISAIRLDRDSLPKSE